MPGLPPASGGLGLLGAVLRPGLFAVLDALGIQAAAHDVVTHARQILHTAAANQDHRVLLQVVAFAADVADHLEPVGQAYLRHLPKRGVRLLRRRGVDTGADTALLRTIAQRRHLALGGSAGPPLADQLTDCRHYFRVPKKRRRPLPSLGRHAEVERLKILSGKPHRRQQLNDLSTRWARRRRSRPSPLVRSLWWYRIDTCFSAGCGRRRGG